MDGNFYKSWIAVCLCQREVIRGFVYYTEESLGSLENAESENVKIQWEKGYDLPIEDSEKEEAEADCKTVLGTVVEIYRLADKGEASNVVLPDEAILQMKEVIKEIGNPVIGSDAYSVMENYGEMEKFLLSSEQGKPGTIILYEIQWLHMFPIRE